MEKTTYAFIDGSYVRNQINRAMNEVFGVNGEMAPELIAPVDAFRVYYYDCIDDLKRDSESDVKFAARVEAQNENLSQMRVRAGLHFRLGTLKGGKRREQKEVDILLAVDMLTHGFNRKMTHAILVAGDLDFRPVVEALVKSGVFVEVWAEKRSRAPELPSAADFGVEITWPALYSWNGLPFRQKFHPPVYTKNYREILFDQHVRVGYYEGRSVELMKVPGQGPFILRVERPDGLHWFEHPDQLIIERYFTMLFGPIKWK